MYKTIKACALPYTGFKCICSTILRLPMQKIFTIKFCNNCLNIRLLIENMIEIRFVNQYYK